MKISDVISVLEDFAPLSLQEDYDNAGLQTGSSGWEVQGILCTVDVTEEVLDEAIENKDNLIIAHHPVIFRDLKSLTDRTGTERILVKAIKNNLAIYVVHTNVDNVFDGVNKTICEKLGLGGLKILSTGRNMLLKMVTFVPEEHADKVRNALFSAGAGHIGNYDSCSYNLTGQGTFRAGEGTHPFVGEKGKIHFENEIRIETIVPRNRIAYCIKAMTESHPYEEVAYDIYPVENDYNKTGAGMTGEFEKPLSHDRFMELLQKKFNIPVIRYSGKVLKEYRKVAVCGGSGFFLLGKAIRDKAEVFLTSDIKYHQFFENEDKILVCDIGHYESEQFTKDIFYNLLNEKFSNFAVHLSKVVSNPIKYYT
jgi:dinuclear metal center YbgI/SA1388 family protein